MTTMEIEPQRKIVYFDHKGWIDLAKIYYGNPSKIEKQLLEKIIVASDSETAVFPISMINYSETRRISKVKWRKQITSLMVKISKCYTLTPYWSSILDIEIKNLNLEKLGLPALNIRKYWLGKGFAHLMGQTPRIVSENMEPDELVHLNQQLLDALNSPETFELMLKDYNKDESLELENIKAVAEFERIRKNLQKIKDNVRRKKMFMAVNTRATVSPRIIKTLIDFKLPKEFLNIIFPKGDIEKFLSKLPTALCEFTLLFQRDQQLLRPVEINDMYDIWHLTLAIPHSDIVVTENMWTSIARNAKLVEKCNTKILSSLIDLDEFL